MFDHDVLTVPHALWLDALVLRARPSAWAAFFFLVIPEAAHAALYATRVTFQGDGNVNSAVVYTYPEVLFGLFGAPTSTVFFHGVIDPRLL